MYGAFGRAMLAATSARVTAGKAFPFIGHGFDERGQLYSV
jgi:hypothetical protein